MGKAAEWVKNQDLKKFGGKYETLSIKIIDVSRVSEMNTALSTQDIVHIDIIGHAGKSYVAVGSSPEPDTNLSDNGGKADVSPSKLNWGNLTQDATITIYGCNAGADKDGIAQRIADASQAPVSAPTTYINFDEGTGEPFIRWLRFGEWLTFTPEPQQPSGDSH